MPLRAMRSRMWRVRQSRRQRGCRRPCRRAACRGACAGVRGLLDRRDGIEQRPRRRRVVDVGPVRSAASGMPVRSTTTWRFVPGLPRSVGFGPARCPPFGRHAGAVQRGAAPVDAVGFPQAIEQAWCRRSHTPASCQSRRRRQQVIPEPQPNSCGSTSQGMPDLEDEDDASQRGPIGHARSATFRAWVARMEQRATRAHNSSLTKGLLMFHVCHGQHRVC